MKFRSKGKGSGRKVYPVRGRSLYNQPPKHPGLAEQIHLDNPTNAKKSIAYLNERWDKADSRSDRVLLVRAANQAANRAEAASHNDNLSFTERDEAKEIGEYYRDFVDKHKGQY